MRYILVGDLERENHRMGLEKFDELTPVFRSGGTAIYQVR